MSISYVYMSYPVLGVFVLAILLVTVVLVSVWPCYISAPDFYAMTFHF
uniref:Uncharacterized protein n=1 Tax=Rhizophora mucronata TaxID=61149 RepID=A0A2P2P8B3_RHIMU